MRMSGNKSAISKLGSFSAIYNVFRNACNRQIYRNLEVPAVLKQHGGRS